MKKREELTRNELHRSFFNQAPVPLAVLSEDGHIWDANLSFHQLLGYKPADLLGRPYTDLLHPEEIQQFIAERQKLLAGEIRNVELILNHLKKDGTLTSIILNSNILKSGDEAPLHQMIQLFETRIFDADKDMIQEKSYLNSFIDGFSGSIYFKNRESQFVKVNKHFLEKYGIKSQAEIIGKNDFDILSSREAKKTKADDQKILSTGTTLENVVEKVERKDGQITWESINKMPLRNSKGKIIGTFGISTDITREKMHEMELSEKTKILHALTEKIAIVIYKFNFETGLSLLFGTQKMTSILQKSKVAKLKFPEAATRLLQKFSEKKIKKKYLHFYSINKDDAQEQYFENFIFPRDSNQQDFIGLAINITEKKQFELSLKKNSKSIEKINTELNQFAYIVSHDLKAPLRAITNLSEWIEEDLQEIDNEEVVQNLQLMRGRVKRMENLIQGILSYSRIGRSKVDNDQVDTKVLISEIIDSQAIPKGFNINIPNNLPVIHCPKVNLEQVFANLVSNAVKYHDRQTGIIDIGYRLAGGFHEFSVADDGPGIAPEYHEKVFMIFQTLQARDTVESTGVGLSIVKKIIEGLGGTIRIDSKEGLGAKFIFTIPASGEEQN